MLDITKDRFDVTIVGCGFAGLYLAQLLSRKYKVCVIEKNDSLIEPLRTTGSTLYNDKDDIFTLFDIPKNLIISNYNSAIIHSQTGSVTTSPNNFSWVLLDIPRLKQHIKDKIDNSSTVLLNHEVINIVEKEGIYDGVEVFDTKTGNKIFIRSKIIVDATGSCVTLASKTGMKIPRYKSRCYQIDANLNKNIDNSQVQMYMGFDFCPTGYAYIFPIDTTRVRIGTNFIPSLNVNNFTTQKLFDDFLKYLKVDVTNIDNIVDIEVFTGGINKNNHHLNLLAIGDSAGHLSPVIGEGIRFAFHSADIANLLIDEYFVTNNTLVFKKFYNLWKKRFGNTFSISYMLQFILIHINNNLIDKFIYRLKKASIRHTNLVFRIFSTKFNIYDIIKIFV